ncbi:MAG: alpha/beta hydrolase [Planctomycetaceae bacterium]
MRKHSQSLTLASLLAIVSILTNIVHAREPDEIIDIWPDFAPGETTRETGTALPSRPNDNPPATRIKDITRPQLHVFKPSAEKQNGTVVLIFPGGGYNYVVVDKEGSEAAEWLNSLGITGIVVYYRTKAEPTSKRDPSLPDHAERPLQDGQRAIGLIRKRAGDRGIKADRIGVLGFSAGGQAGAFVTTRFADRAYDPLDDVDEVSCRPDFAMLLYPWNLYDEKTETLAKSVTITENTPPTFLVHTHDDGVTSLSSVMLYAALKKQGINSELHIYQTGGHGYGLRPVENSEVDTWPARAGDWLRGLGLVEKADK